MESKNGKQPWMVAAKVILMAGATWPDCFVFLDQTLSFRAWSPEFQKLLPAVSHLIDPGYKLRITRKIGGNRIPPSWNLH
jgi:hypothetical protein